MKRYWWVNHKQTIRQEVAGGYLWSPKAESNGARSQFYNNMRSAAPGDLVLSLANASVSYVGCVSDFAFSAPKPGEFGAVGANWAASGWLLPLAWSKLPTPVRPKDVLEELAPLLPAKYSPIRAETGHGNEKAYLAEISHQVFQLMMRWSGMNEGSLSDYQPPPRFRELSELIDEAVVKHIGNDRTLGDTEREQVLKARCGQGLFRQNVRRIESGCRITGVNNPALLVASHIQPWRSCTTASERLDGYNGLLLAPHADHLFDRGFISFLDNGRVLVSSKLSTEEVAQLGLAEGFSRCAGSFAPEQLAYLEHHRINVFVP